MMHAKTNLTLIAVTLAAAASCVGVDPESDLPEGEAAPTEFRGSEDAEPIDPDALVMDDDRAETLTTLSAKEVSDLREEAERTELEGLPEEDSRGLPALHYAMIEVRDETDVKRLGELGIHWDILPLFESEQPQVEPGAIMYVEPPSDEHGAYVYALLPAALFNALVEAQRQGEALFPTMILRRVGDERAIDIEATSVSYAWLQDEGFVWDAPVDEEVLPEDGGGPVANKVRALAERVALVQDYAADAMARVQQQLGEPTPVVLLQRAVVRAQLVLRSTDPVFRDGSGVGRRIRRGWGDQRGRFADIRGANVVARQGANRIRRPLDAFNRANVEVRRGRETTWCVDLASTGAKLTTNFYTSTQVCSFASPVGSTVYEEDTQQIIDVSNSRVATLAYLTDAWRYLVEIAEIDPLRVDVLVGPIAEQINSNDRPYATCGSYYGALATVTFASTLGALGVVPELTLGHIDLVLPTSATRARGIVTHEWGHFGMCSLMAETAPTRFEFAWSDVILSTLVPQIGTGGSDNRGLEDDASWLNEGFADFLASQVVGATNYFGGVGSISDGEGSNYCRAQADDCLETNRLFPDLTNQTQDSPVLHNAAVAGFATLLLDAVDGHPYPVFDQSRDVPGNGGIWTLGPLAPAVVISEATAVSPRQNDEVVHADGTLLPRLFEEWKERTPVVTGWSKEDVLPSLSAAMRAAGANDSQICRVFSLHTSGAPVERACLALLPDSDLEIDPALTDLANGDLLTPASLFCTTPGMPGDNDLFCRWEDFSIDADAFVIRMFDDDTGELIDELTQGFSVYASRTLPVGPAGGTFRIEVETVKDTRVSGSTTTTTFSAPQTCGDGVVQAGEVCDGGLFPAGSCSTTPECPACQCNDCVSIELLCI